MISNSGMFFLIDFTDLNHLDSLKMKNILNNEKGGGGGDSGIIEPIKKFFFFYCLVNYNPEGHYHKLISLVVFGSEAPESDGSHAALRLAEAESFARRLLSPCRLAARRRHAFRKHPQQAEDELLLGAGVPRPEPAQQPHGQGADARDVRQPARQGDAQRLHRGRRHPDRRGQPR